MYAGRTSEIAVMTDFENFRQDLFDLVKKYHPDIPLKIEEDLENNIVKIFGAKMTSLARAQNGLNDMAELAYTTAEHHPYWNLLYNCSEIANTVLDKWKNSLSSDDFKDIDWALKEIRQTLEKIRDKEPLEHDC
jgi:pterin-4a-carbinolamine dehydratase